jgi:hypothetical protein
MLGSLGGLGAGIGADGRPQQRNQQLHSVSVSSPAELSRTGLSGFRLSAGALT